MTTTFSTFSVGVEEASACHFITRTSTSNNANNANNDEKDILYVGLMNGSLARIECDEQNFEPKKMSVTEISTSSIRCITSNSPVVEDINNTKSTTNYTTKTLYTGSSDGSLGIIDVETNTLCYRIRKAHSDSISAIHILNNNNGNGNGNGNGNILVSGDDNGVVKIWDLRTMKRVQRYHEHEDYVSGISSTQSKPNALVSVGGDGYLTVYDSRKPDLIARSDNLEDELTDLCILRSGSKVIASSILGCIHVFSWDKWGDESDRFPNLPAATHKLQKIDENSVVAGFADGTVRTLDLFPNKIVNTVALSDDSPVEDLALGSKYLCIVSSFASRIHLLKINNDKNESENENDDDDKSESYDDDESESEIDDDDDESEKRGGIFQPQKSFFADLLDDDIISE